MEMNQSQKVLQEGRQENDTYKVGLKTGQHRKISDGELIAAHARLMRERKEEFNKVCSKERNEKRQT
jgi:hypothetical protein